MIKLMLLTCMSLLVLVLAATAYTVAMVYVTVFRLTTGLVP